MSESFLAHENFKQDIISKNYKIVLGAQLHHEFLYDEGKKISVNLWIHFIIFYLLENHTAKAFEVYRTWYLARGTWKKNLRGKVWAGFYDDWI